MMEGDGFMDGLCLTSPMNPKGQLLQHAINLQKGQNSCALALNWKHAWLGLGRLRPLVGQVISAKLEQFSSPPQTTIRVCGKQGKEPVNADWLKRKST